MQRIFLIFEFLSICLSLSAISSVTRTDECRELLQQGNQAFNEERYDVALDLYTRSLELADEAGDITTYTSALGSIGNLYGIFRNFNRATYYFYKGYKATLEQDERLQAIFLTNLVMSTSYAHDAPLTHDYYDLLRQLPAWHPQLSPYYDYVCQSCVSQVDGDYPRAIQLAREGLHCAQQSNLGQQYILAQYETIGVTYQLQGQPDSALYYYQYILDHATGTGHLELTYAACIHLSELYLSLGDTLRNLDYTARTAMIRDTLMHSSQMDEALNRLFAYEKRANDRQVMSLHRTINTQLIILCIIIALAFCLIILAISLHYKHHKLNDMYQLMVDKNEEELRQEKRLRQRRNEEPTNVPTTDEEGDTYVGLNLSTELVQQLRVEIDDVMSDIRNISNPDFNLALLARLVDSNTKYVSYVINDTYQKNFKTYLNEFRIREASRRLSDPEYANVTIQAIAEMVGFNSSSTFISAFKKVLGMTPSVYQRLATKKA